MRLGRCRPPQILTLRGCESIVARMERSEIRESRPLTQPRISLRSIRATKESLILRSVAKRRVSKDEAEAARGNTRACILRDARKGALLRMRVEGTTASD